MNRIRPIQRAFNSLLLLLAFTLLLVCSSWAQSTDLRRIGVLTPGGDFGGVLEGLRQGMAQLGYVEGKQITFIVEDTKMETLDPLKAAMRLIAAKPALDLAAERDSGDPSRATRTAARFYPVGPGASAAPHCEILTTKYEIRASLSSAYRIPAWVFPRMRSQTFFRSTARAAAARLPSTKEPALDW